MADFTEDDSLESVLGVRQTIACHRHDSKFLKKCMWTQGMNKVIVIFSGPHVATYASIRY